MGNDRIFTALAEQLKVPLMQATQAVELLALTGNATQERIDEARTVVSAVNMAAIRLVDNYVLGVRLQREARLLEPVAVSSVLYDVAHSLDEYAKIHECRLELDVTGRFKPVMAHKEALQAALVSLGHSFIEAASEMTAQSPYRQPVVLAVRRVPGGINTGVFSEHTTLGPALLRQARELCGTVRHPFGGFSSGGGAGVYIADTLFSGLEARLRTASHRQCNGLAATLVPSRQLTLV